MNSLFESGRVKDWMERQGIVLWGYADLHGFTTPVDDGEQEFPGALAWACPMDPVVMQGIRNGPDAVYVDEYSRVNRFINDTSTALAEWIRSMGYRARPLAASERTDPVGIKGDFPHKTAAPGGLGLDRSELSTGDSRFRAWVRLGTVFTDLPLEAAQPMDRSKCGTCRQCVESCPATALTGTAWVPGIQREKILDPHRCDGWKKENYLHLHQGHVCGICSSACPFGQKYFRKSVPA